MFSIKNKKYSKYNGFTLIELIVVITILAILGTISFVSFNGYSSSARDSARVSDLSNISKALSVYYTTNGSLPMPSGNYTNITSSGTTIGYQGYAGSDVLSSIKISPSKVYDPLDKIEYTYLVNSDKNKYQLLGFGERNDGNISFNLNSIHNKSEAADYTNRYPTFRGDKLGVILEKNTNIPLQENTSLHTSTNTFDVVTFSGAGSKQVSVYFDKNDTIGGAGNLGIVHYSFKDGAHNIKKIPSGEKIVIYSGYNNGTLYELKLPNSTILQQNKNTTLNTVTYIYNSIGTNIDSSIEIVIPNQDCPYGWTKTGDYIIKIPNGALLNMYIGDTKINGASICKSNGYGYPKGISSVFVGESCPNGWNDKGEYIVKLANGTIINSYINAAVSKMRVCES